MWSGFCGELIRKTGLRLLTLILIGAAGLLLFFAWNHAYFRGFFGGPAMATQAQLLAAKNAAAFPNAILTVNGGATAGTGLYQRTRNDSHPEGYISARFLATEIGAKRMLVRVAPENPLAQDVIDPTSAGTFKTESSVTLTGRAVPLTPGLSERLAVATAAGDEQYLPYLLDTYEYKSFGWFSSVIGGLLLVGVLWGLRKYLQRKRDPSRDLFARSLSSYGPLETVVPQVDAEMASAHTSIKKGANTVHIGQNWLVVATPLRGFGARLDGLVWAYRLIVKKRVYFVIPAGTRHTLIAYDRYGQKMTAQLDEAKTTEALQFLRKVAPQAVYGYDKRLIRLWKAGSKSADRAGFIAESEAVLAGASLPEALTRKQYTGG